METEFEINDKVISFGSHGIITKMAGVKYALEVKFMCSGNVEYFTAQGKLQTWHKDPSLFIVEKAKKKKTKKFWLWGSNFGYVKLADDMGKSPKGTCVFDSDDCKVKIPNTEIELEI